MTVQNRELSKRAKRWLDVLEYVLQTDLEQLYRKCQELFQEEASENSDELIGLGYYYLALYYMGNSEADQVMDALMEGIKYYPGAGMYEYMARAYNLMGVVAESQDNFILALEYYYTCMSYSETYHMTYIMAMVESNTANILYSMKETARATGLLKSAVKHYREAEETPYTRWNLMLCSVELGHCYLMQKQYKEADGENQKLDALIKECGNGRLPLIAIDSYKAEISYYRGEEKEAVRYAEKVMEDVRRGASVIEHTDSLERMAELLIRMEKYEVLLQLQDIIGEKMQDTANLSLKAKWYLNCITCYDRLGREEDYVNGCRCFFEIYKAYSDNGMQTALKAIELRDKLNKIQQRQTDMLALNAELRVTSKHDAMTGMANRTFLNEYIEQCFENAVQEQKNFGVELMDIDYFKLYNDFYGHLQGDDCIERVARVLKGMENDKIFCARYGGDEFMIIYYDMSGEEIRDTAMKIKDTIWRMKIPHEKNRDGKLVTVSQGIVCRIPEENRRVWDYALKADRLLYLVKNQGRNGILLEERL